MILRAVGIDFGDASTVVAGWDASIQQYRAFSLADYPVLPGTTEENGCEAVPVVPSIIHYAPSGERLVGAQVLRQGLLDAPGTVRWLRHYIASRHPARMLINGARISYADAGGEFLQSVVTAAIGQPGIPADSVVFSVPAGTGGAYEAWLSGVATGAGVQRIRFVDEPIAAALGYGAAIRANDVFLHIDLGSRSIAIALMRADSDISPDSPTPCCRLLGRTEEDHGGLVIDEWAVLGKSGPVLPGTSPERNPGAGGNGTGEMPGRHDLMKRLERAIRHTRDLATNHGYAEDRITHVLVTGCCGCIPSVREAILAQFGDDRVFCNRPLGAVALGAALFGSACRVQDQIRCRYAVRFWNTEERRYEYRSVVHPGTPFPSKGPVTRFFIRATFEGQSIMGIPVYLLPESGVSGQDQGIELVADPSGGITIAATPGGTRGPDARFVNEQEPTFLVAEPAAHHGELRFEVQLAIDGGRNLLISARDLRTGAYVKRDHPLVRLE